MLDVYSENPSELVTSRKTTVFLELLSENAL